MVTPAPSLYYDALTTPDAMTDVNQPPKSKPSPSDPSPEYVHSQNQPATHENPKNNTTAPNKTAHERAATAESTIPHTVTSRLSRIEAKDAKRVSVVLKNEGRTDTKVLKAALTELERLQKLHKDAAKDEAAALSSHGKAIKSEHKMKMRFLDAQANHEAAVAELQAREGALTATREHVRKQAVLLHDKEAEIKNMREKKAVEDREREVRMKQLTMSPTNASSA